MLLVWQGKSSQVYWQIGKRRAKLSNFEEALKSYWDSIASNFPGVAAIDVIIIDLTLRNTKSNV